MTRQEQILADDKMRVEIAKMSAEIAKMTAEIPNISAQTIKLHTETIKLNTENQWYLPVVGSAATLAILAVAKIFL